MTKDRSKAKGFLTQLWQWVKDQIILDVPEDTGLCEYDCRKKQCTMGEWATCDRRLQKAAGELMPGGSDSVTKASHQDSDASA